MRNPEYYESKNLKDYFIDERFHCKECNSIGFKPSKTGKGCTFCDGTEGGNPPDLKEEN